MIHAICFITLFLLIWFKTDAFVTYMKLFGLSKLFKINEYLEVSKSDPSFSYPSFLLEYYNCFFTQLTSCAICLSVWLGLLLCLITGWYTMPTITFFGLLLYAIIVKIL